MTPTKLVWVLLLILGVTGTATADRVFLRNGDVITGTVIESNTDEVIVATDMGDVRIPRDRIERIQFTTNDDREPELIRNSSVQIRPLPTVLGIILGSADVLIEGQTALTPSFALSSTFGVTYGMGHFGMESQLGVQFRPLGGYLSGWYWELLLGYGWVELSFDMIWFGTLSLNTGYQWVMNRGFALNLAVGLSVSTIPALPVKPNLIFGVGYAFPDPIVKPRRP